MIVLSASMARGDDLTTWPIGIKIEVIDPIRNRLGRPQDVMRDGLHFDL